MKDVKLELVKEGEFLGTKCDFYKDDKNNIYMTREQIGSALQYSEPRIAIYKIHQRNQERLEQYSVVTKLTTTDGKQYDTMLYVARGIYEICRFSKQPLANDFYDWVYDQIETLRVTKGVISAGDEMEFLDNYFPSLSEETKLMMVIDLQTSIKEKDKLIEDMQPKVDEWEAFMNSAGEITMSKVAKVLNVPHLGRNKLFDILRKNKVLRSNNEPYQQYVDSNYFRVVVGSKNGFKFTQTLVTSKGLSWLNKKLMEWSCV